MGFFDIFKVSQYKSEIETLKKQNDELKQKLSELCFDDYDTSQRIIQQLKQEIEKSKEEALNLENQRALLKNKLNDETESTKEKLNDLKIKTDERILSLNVEIEKTEKKLKTAKNKLDRTKELYKSVDYSISNFFEYSPDLAELKLYKSEFDELEELSPSVILKLHYMDVKSLRKAFKDNDKQIEKVLSQYRSRYTTKANKAIYDLMVIALRAELQNILYNLKYEKLDNAIEQVKNTSQKYLNIAAQGNQNIAGTLTKFIGEIEYLFINAVKIEYNYYVKKEQAKQEQLAIKEQIRQEAEERKPLEHQKKKIENEELKYNNENEKLKHHI